MTKRKDYLGSHKKLFIWLGICTAKEEQKHCWFRIWCAHGSAFEKFPRAHLWSRYRDTAGIRVTVLAMLPVYRFQSDWVFFKPLLGTEKKNHYFLKFSPVSSSNASWRCVALGTRIMVREIAQTSDYSNTPLHEPAKKGMEIQGRFLCAISKNQVKVQPLDLRNKPFHDTPISKNGWESSTALTFPSLAPKS